MAQVTQQVAPVKLPTRGHIVVQGYDFSQAQGYVADWTNQGASRTMQIVVGIYLDNSKNTNSVTITLSNTNQTFTIYGGEVATYPVFALSLPRISVMCNNDGTTPGVGYTQIIYTDFDIGFNVAQTGSGASIVVQDNNLAAIITAMQQSMSSPVVKALSVAPAVVMGTAVVTSQITLTGTSQSVIPGSATRHGWYLQNINASDFVYVSFTAIPSATSGAIKLAAGQMLTSSQFSGTTLGFPVNVIGTANDLVNVGYW